MSSIYNKQSQLFSKLCIMIFYISRYIRICHHSISNKFGTTARAKSYRFNVIFL